MSVLGSAVHPGELILIPRRYLLGEGKGTARWCLVDTGTRSLRLVDGRAEALAGLAAGRTPTEETDTAAIMHRLTLAICSRYLVRTMPGQARPGLPVVPVRRVHRDHPSAGGLGSVSVCQMDGCDARPRHMGIVADLTRLTGKYRQPRSAYLPFLESGHVLENIALGQSVTALGVGGAARLYQIGPWLSDGLKLRILCLSGAPHVPPTSPAGLGELAVNPSLAVLLTGGGLRAITTWPRLRSDPLSPPEFGLLSQALTNAVEDPLRQSGLPACLRERDIVTVGCPSWHDELTRDGWHGAVPGWLGAPESNASAPDVLATEPLLSPEALRRAYARRRSAHVFDDRPVEAAQLEAALRAVYPERLGISMDLILLGRGTDYQVMSWADDHFTGAATRSHDVAEVMAADPGFTAPAGYVVLTAPLSGRRLAAALVALGRIGQRVILALTAADLASCPIHVMDDAAVHALVGRAPCYDPSHVITFGQPAGAG